MNRNRLILIGSLALFLAAFVSIAAYRILNATLASAKQSNTPVVAAAVDLPVGTMIQESDLRLIKMPGSDLPQGVFHSTSELVGRGVLVPMFKSEIVLENKLASAQAGAGLPSIIPSGMRAVSVKVNDVVSVAGFVVPGTRVDVILTGNPHRDNDPGQITTTTVLQNVQVLAAGPKMEKDSNGKPQSVPVITLLVSPEDAQKLTLASSEGKIQLSLRNPLDLEAEKPDALKNLALYQGAAPPPPPKVRKAKVKEAPPLPPPAAVYVVEMIRGDKRDVSKF